MSQARKLLIDGMPPTLPEEDAAVYRSRFLSLVSDLLRKTNQPEIKVTIGTPSLMKARIGTELEEGGQYDLATEKRALQYRAQQALYRFEQLVVPADLREQLLAAAEIKRVEHLVFQEWGLEEIEPFPSMALNFYGPPGTGKTLAAHAIANYLGQNIFVASYAEIESKYHGDGPKNVKAIFHAAERDNAVLFIDEADSLLSKRLTNVTQGSEQAINSMRSQLLICLQQFRGIVIFATNLVENYDKAFETRVRHLYFPLPDETARRHLWRKMLVPRLPIAPDVSAEYLAAYSDTLCGRDIKNAIIDAALQTARAGGRMIPLQTFRSGIDQIKAAKAALAARGPQPLTPEELKHVNQEVRENLANGTYSLE